MGKGFRRNRPVSQFQKQNWRPACKGGKEDAVFGYLLSVIRVNLFTSDEERLEHLFKLCKDLSTRPVRRKNRRCFVNGIIDDFENKAFNSTAYLLRGLLFRKSFDIIDLSGNIVLRAKPAAIFSGRTSIVTRQGEKTVTVQDKTSFKDAYFSGVYRCEFKDVLTNENIGGLRGIKTRSSPDGVEWQILDPKMMQIGHIEEEATPPNVRFGGKPTYDIVTGFIGGEKAFLFKVNIHSFRFEMSADFSMDGCGMLDRKLGIALAVFFACMKRTKDLS